MTFPPKRALRDHLVQTSPFMSGVTVWESMMCSRPHGWGLPQRLLPGPASRSASIPSMLLSKRALNNSCVLWLAISQACCSCWSQYEFSRGGCWLAHLQSGPVGSLCCKEGRAHKLPFFMRKVSGTEFCSANLDPACLQSWLIALLEFIPRRL